MGPRGERHWAVYECGPIDFFDGTVEVVRYLKLLAEDGADHDEIEGFVEKFESAVTAVYAGSYWEGDGDWRIASIPDPDSFTMWPLFIVKQLNNGSTFIAAEIELPWLEKDRSQRQRQKPPLGNESVEAVRQLARLLLAEQLGTH